MSGRPKLARNYIMPGTQVWDAIAANYGKAKTAEIAVHYGVTVAAVYKAAERMGLKLQTHNAWSPEEEAYVVEHHHLPAPQLRRELLDLFGIDRSERGIGWKRKMLRKQGLIPPYRKPEMETVKDPVPARVSEFWRR